MSRPMTVLVGCEYSGTERDAFLARGHEAMSCDLLPTDVPGPHYQGDVRDVIADPLRFFSRPIDLAIFHPDCTYLCRAGQRWLNAPDDYRPGKLKGKPRRLATAIAAGFFAELLQVDIPRVAVENPRPGSHVAHLIGKPDQVVQPWQYGHPEKKATGLWLKGLPPLVATDDVSEVMATLPASETDRIHRAKPGPDRWKIRSTSFAGIAAAMAEQWGEE